MEAEFDGFVVKDVLESNDIELIEYVYKYVCAEYDSIFTKCLPILGGVDIEIVCWYNTVNELFKDKIKELNAQ